MYRIRPRAAIFGIAFAFFAAGSLATAAPARAEALLLVDADSGKVLRAENATYPWFPASTTKLMTLYMTLSAITDHRITFDTLFTVSPNSTAQPPTKMGFPVGTQVTVDNALKMMMVKSANDMAVLLAEGIGGTIDNFSEQMTDTAHRLGMTETNYVNPNGLPADGQITSARDLAILARALMHDFPQYSFYWHIPAIKYGRRIVRNYNPLLGRYPGTDGMKTGFICASGFNLVATATRDNKHLIAVVLGAPSAVARAVKAAEMLESGFTQNPLAWLTPALGTVDQLAPIDATPPDLKDEMCGPHRKRPAAEDDDIDAGTDATGASDNGDSTAQFSSLLAALRAPNSKNANLLSDLTPVTPVVVYTGPTRTPEQLSRLANLKPTEATASGRRKAKGKATAEKAKEESANDANGRVEKVKDTKAEGKKGVRGKRTAGADHWTPMTSTPLAISPPPDLRVHAATPKTKKKSKDHSAVEPSATQ
ncbi:MAG TPA: D-alanyl-D-alanine carboxypeptidase family protein [Xanthobacteraceae bacterium]